MEHAIIYSISSGCLFFLALGVLTISATKNIKANSWLSLFLLAFACVLLDRVLFDIHVYHTSSKIQGLLEITRFAMSPALYFSVLYFTIPDRKYKTTDALHFLPFLLFAIYIVLVFFNLTNSVAFSWYYTLPDNFRRGIATTVFVSIKIQMIVYWLLAYRQLLRHERNISLFVSSLEPVSLNWLRYFLIGLAGLLCISLNEVLRIVPALIPFTHYSYLILTFYAGFFALRQQEIYPYKQNDIEALHTLIQETETAPLTRPERMLPDELEVYKERLRQMMETEKLYLNPDLGLPQLAEALKISTHNLSFVINAGFQENFFHFINRYRIEEAKILLISPKHKHLSILGIAFESGFRSKTTFNTTFKKITGLSPSQFIERASPDTERIKQ